MTWHETVQVEAAVEVVLVLVLVMAEAKADSHLEDLTEVTTMKVKM